MGESAEQPSILERALSNLQERFALLGVQARSVQTSEWDALDPDIRSLVPPWICDVLGRYAVAGGALEARDPIKRLQRVFAFFTPPDYATLFADGEFRELAAYSLAAIANEQDGCAWVVRPADGPMGQVWLLEHSEWDGGEPSKTNGLRFAAESLAHLLCSMAVSQLSYDGGERGWHKPRSMF